MEVNTCPMLTTRLTAAAISSTGAANQSVVSRVLRARVMISGMSNTSRKALHQRTDDEVPSIHHYEQQDLERRRDDDRWQLQHSHRSCDGSDHQVHDQKRQKQHQANLKS